MGRSHTLPSQSCGEAVGAAEATSLLETETRLVIVLELYSLDAGAGVALVAAQALHASPLVRVAHAAAAPVQVAREIVCAFNVHVDLFPVGVRALGGDGGARAVHPYPLNAQLLQLPLQVSLLSLKLVYLMNGSPVTIFKFLYVQFGFC